MTAEVFENPSEATIEQIRTTDKNLKIGELATGAAAIAATLGVIGEALQGDYGAAGIGAAIAVAALDGVIDFRNARNQLGEISPES